MSFGKLAPQTIYVSATPSTYEEEHSCEVIEQVVRLKGLRDPVIEVRPAGSQVDDLLSEINKLAKFKERIV